MAVAEYYGAIFVDGSSCYDHGHRSFDGLHMNAYGHQVVATRLLPVVQRLLSANTVTQQVRTPTEHVTPDQSRSKSRSGKYLSRGNLEAFVRSAAVREWRRAARRGPH